MKKFEPTVEWLKSVLPDKYAKDIKNWWCWPELGIYYRTHDIPEEVIKPVVEVIKGSRSGWVCCKYCRFIENREELVQVVKKYGSSYDCYLYCKFVEDRGDLRRTAEKEGI